MRAIWILVPTFSIIAGCARPETQLPKAAPTAAQNATDTTSPAAQLVMQDTAPALQGTLPSGYRLTDTTEWGNMLEEGQRAVLRHGEVTIDTVDLEFGVAAVGEDSLVFLRVRTDSARLPTSPTPAYESFPTDHVLWTPASQRKLSDFLRFFDPYFSSPRIVGTSGLLYWGIAPRVGTNGLYAMRYDFRSARLDSLFLNREDPLATDYRYHLGRPQMRGSEVAFDSVVLDATTWRRLRQSPSPKQ